MPRYFLALKPPIEAVRYLLDRAAIDVAATPGAWRLASEEQIHLTLHFIGAVEPRRMDGVVESVERSAAGLHAFDLRVDRRGTLPEDGPPRVLAAFTDTPSDMMEIQRRAFHRLASREQRARGNRFRPHITLARTSAPDAQGPSESPTEPVLFNVSEVHLIRSDLRASGPLHTPIHAVGLSLPRSRRV